MRSKGLPLYRQLCTQLKGIAALVKALRFDKR
jgi:hypothetical protein